MMELESAGEASMKRLQLAGAALFLLMTPAMSADLMVKAPPPPMLWTGCYGGGNVGGVLADVNVQWTADPVNFGGAGAAADVNDFGSTIFHPTGAAAGAQLGCNYQFGQYVFGVETDFGYTGIDSARTITSPAINQPPFTVTETAKSDFLATMRGRVGLISGPDGSWLFYGTGGVAIAGVHFGDQACFPLGIGGCNIATADQTKLGWTVGTGAEWAFAPQWSVKVEYLYVTFGLVSSTSTNTLNPLATIIHDHTLTENIGRVGVNWHFGNTN
jgi:outer membrane immunogenic protein